MRITLPRLRCLDGAKRTKKRCETRHHVFVFTPPRGGPHQIGIVFSRYDWYGNPVTKPIIVNLAYQPADRVLTAGELLIVTADNMALLRFVEECGMFQRDKA
jgi:hypothetical protein